MIRKFYTIFIVLLSGLRKLSLLGLENMPKITDTAFKLVFRHLPLTHFELGSKSAVSTVSEFITVVTNKILPNPNLILFNILLFHLHL